MAGKSIVIEGPVKYRDGKKWKPRWCVVRKLSPVADCLHLQLYRDVKERDKQCQTKASLSLDGFLALECGFTLDKESNTLALVCPDIVVVLAFDTRETLIEWQVRVRTHLNEDQQFSVDIVHVPPKSKILPCSAKLHLQDRVFCLTTGLPPKLLGQWQLQDLRRYGIVNGQFCFEGGSRCGRGEGLHILSSNQAEQIVTYFEFATQGQLELKKRASARRNTAFDGPTQRLIRRPSHWPSALCSTESWRPLHHSSRSSVGDASGCGETPLSVADELEPSIKLLKQRPVSCESGSGYGSGFDSADTLSLAISDLPDVGHHAGTSGDLLCDWPLSPDSRVDQESEEEATFHHCCRRIVHSTSLNNDAPTTYAESVYDRPRNLFIRDESVSGFTFSNRSGTRSMSGSPTLPRRRIPTQHLEHVTSCGIIDRPSTTMVSVSKARMLSPPPPYGCVFENRSPTPLQPSPVNYTGPYANYDVPKSTRVYTEKEKQMLTRHIANIEASNKCRTSIVSSDGTDYDVPKRIKECVLKDRPCPHVMCTNNSPQQSPASISSSSSCANWSSWSYPTLPVAEPWTVCNCQQVAFWAEHFVCRQRLDEFNNLIFAHRVVRPINSRTTAKHSPTDSSSCSRIEFRPGSKCQPESIPEIESGDMKGAVCSTCTCRSTIIETSTEGSQNATISEVQSLLGSSTQSKELASKPPVHRDNKPILNTGSAKCFKDYANLEFMENLRFYENVSAVLAKAEGTKVPNLAEKADLTCAKLMSRCNCHDLEAITSFSVKSDGESSSVSRIPKRDIMIKPVLVPVPGSENLVAPDDNYLPMQPSYVHYCSESFGTNLVDSEFPEYMAMNLEDNVSIGNKSGFSASVEDVRSSDSPSQNLPITTGKRSKFLCRTRSNSYAEMKRKIGYRKRSSSADSRYEFKSPSVGRCHGKATIGCGGHHYRKSSLESKMPECGKSNGLETGFKPLSKNRFHLEDTYSSSDCDGQSESVGSSNSSSANISIMRSSSVPCKPGNRNSASSSDSGVSTGSPRQQSNVLDGVCSTTSHQEPSLLTVLPPPLPPRNSDRVDNVKAASSRHQGINSCRSRSRYLQQADSSRSNALGTPIIHNGLSQNRTAGLEQGSACTTDSKSTSSSTMSDLSDYIETLSLSSHGSGETSGDSSGCPPSLTNTLRPRSGREYQKVDRIALDEIGTD